MLLSTKKSVLVALVSSFHLVRSFAPRSAATAAANSFAVMAPRLLTTTTPSSTTTSSSLQKMRLFQEKPPQNHETGISPDAIPEEIQKQIMAYQEHQQNAPKLDFAADVRTLIQYNHGFAVLSTNSANGYPGGSVVGFAPDELGRPVFLFSTMSTHTQDVDKDPRCSVTIASKEFKGAADGRVNLQGKCQRLTEPEEQEKAKQVYASKHPNAFWMSFGDFYWYRMEVESVRFVGGFARAGKVSAGEYASAKPDPIAAFGPAVAQHMNEDHMDATIAMIETNIPGMMDKTNKITEAVITTVDSLGMYVKVTRERPMSFLPQSFKVRLPFPRPAQDRKDVKTLIVEMTQAAATTAEE